MRPVLAKIKIKINYANPPTHFWIEAIKIGEFSNGSIKVISNNPIGIKNKRIRQFVVKSLYWRESNHEMTKEAREYLESNKYLIKELTT